MARPLKSITEFLSPIDAVTQNIAANWKICYHMTLEDYHIGTAHPKTFSMSGLLKRGGYRYFFEGPHSALFVGEDIHEKAFTIFHAECAQGRLPKTGYYIFQMFPNSLILLWDGVIYLSRYNARAPAKTLMESYCFQAVKPNEETFSDHKQKELMSFFKTANDEDALSAERLQQTCCHIPIQPLFGGQEERIVRFDDAYAKFMAID